jgi:pimeloyl-ACP methyl ester carboxylesterase
MKRTYFIGPYFIREWGNPDGKPLLLIHGNAVHSGVWDLVGERFPKEYRIIAPDLRGYGKTSRELKVNAENGVQNWVDDLISIVSELRLENVEVWGHSLGGSVLWGILSEDPDWLKKAVFISTGSPFGFGKLNWEDGAGTGAGFVHPEFVSYLKNKELGDGSKLTHPISVYS